MARWDLVKDFSTIRRSSFGCCTFNNRIIIACGVRGSTYYGDVWEFDGHNFTMLAPDTTISPRRDSCTLTVHDGKLFLIGGYDGTNYLNDIWESRNGVIWERVDHSRNPFTARDDHMTWSHDNRLWVGCGDNGGAAACLRDLNYSYDGYSGSWRQLVATHGYLNRTDGCGLTFDNRMFAICGINAASTRQPNCAYSQDGINWNQTPDACGLPAVTALGGCVYNRKMVVSCGYGLYYPPREGDSAAGKQDVYYTENGINWRWGGKVKPNDANWSRYNHRMASLAEPNRCYIIFGYDSNAQDSSGEVWETQDEFTDQCSGV